MSNVYVIPTGRENAVHARVLKQKWGLKDEREVRLIIQKLREDGVLIATNANGYYMTDDPDDLLRFYRTQRAKAIGLLKSISATRRYLKERGYKP